MNPPNPSDSGRAAVGTNAITSGSDDFPWWLKFIAIMFTGAIFAVLFRAAVAIPDALTANDPFRQGTPASALVNSGAAAAAASAAPTDTTAAGAPSPVSASAATGAGNTRNAASAAAAPASAAATTAAAAPAPNGVSKVAFKPPADDTLPDGPMGDVIRRGQQIFLHTGTYAKAYVGNSLNCVNCHLDAGRLAKSAPMWGAYGLYPAYRAKTQHVDSFEDRLRGCFEYSMNGKAPPYGGEVLGALQAYAYWMAKGAPAGEKLPGAGYQALPKPAQPPDYQRGLAVYSAQCALCHGANGEGTRSGDTQVFPPLWGAQSYNWGAGMASVKNAAAFIQANMPLSRGGSLSEQDAWDVAQYIDSQDRPQDPRFTGSVEATRKQFHDGDGSMYGQTVNGKLLGRNTR